MKLVREHINEKFTDESDPIKDMGIGLIHKIEEWLDEMCIRNYTINDDFTIDIDNGRNSVNLTANITQIPDYIQFGTVHTSFFCNRCELTTFRGMPRRIDGIFGCSNNKIKTLDYIPREVCRSFFLEENSVKFTVRDIRSRCNVMGSIYV